MTTKTQLTGGSSSLEKELLSSPLEEAIPYNDYEGVLARIKALEKVVDILVVIIKDTKNESSGR